ncbi:uncharacterized protein ACA1_165560 [Acanthamoeba castellanii str. Neff]|uniref:Transmembrane protein n=1 Tax=Acanthamoeba castellanii (strain ATCC 30010 / Neff) TaxID=1257118 RepID=L8HIW0_ACACF|nr:uncharacterized protein ACA1_165560 [Acanthamoeba castellanii str. Neff]ELR24346.1 hypothetical protein ACA1_165560 [Acanthamoeba castellanii str. Neff]
MADKMADKPPAAEEDGGLLMEFFVSMVTPGMVGPRLERLLFGCLGALALVLVLVWWRAGPDVAPHALALLALTALLSASLFWVLGELRVAKEQQSAKQQQQGGKTKKKKKVTKKENNATNAVAAGKQLKATTNDKNKKKNKKKKSKAN